MTNTTIANTILEQIGGRALYMLGAKDKIATECGVQFKIRGSRKANVVRIDLTPADTYTVEIIKYAPIRFNARTGKHTGGTSKVVASFDDVYADGLCEVIESATGLYTSL
jgi:hypothetical protein